jgi:hypothetical protein
MMQVQYAGYPDIDRLQESYPCGMGRNGCIGAHCSVRSQLNPLWISPTPPGTEEPEEELGTHCSVRSQLNPLWISLIPPGTSKQKSRWLPQLWQSPGGQWHDLPHQWRLP